jgi:hypothetical protein
MLADVRCADFAQYITLTKLSRLGSRVYSVTCLEDIITSYQKSNERYSSYNDCAYVDGSDRRVSTPYSYTWATRFISSAHNISIYLRDAAITSGLGAEDWFAQQDGMKNTHTVF